MMRRPTRSSLFPYTTLFRSGVERRPHVLPAHREAHADAGVEPPTGQHVDGGEVLRQAQRVLPAQRDDGGPELDAARALRSEEHTSELQSRQYFVCRLLLVKK